MDSEPETPSAIEHRVDIGNNPALLGLYVLGIAGLSLGFLILAISSNAVSSDYNPAGAYAWQAVGALLTSGGGVLFAGALIAHAVNWQIGRSGLRR